LIPDADLVSLVCLSPRSGGRRVRPRPGRVGLDRRPNARVACSLGTGARPMSQAPRRHLRLENIDGVTVVSFVDTKIVTEENIQEVGDQLYSLVEDDGYTQILLNFGNVQYLSSAALGKLINLNKKVKSVKGKLKLCCIHPDLLEVFRITRLDQVFEIHPEEQTALDKF
jgi:anti-sigma B factor antagonist